METKLDLNAAILKITLLINNKYPELSKYIEEMTITIPNEDSPEITLKGLKMYYDSLNTVLNKYRVEHPEK